MSAIEILQDRFISLITEAQSTFITEFVSWLDYKLAEYKVLGHMVFDESNQRHWQIATPMEPKDWPVASLAKSKMPTSSQTKLLDKNSLISKEGRRKSVCPRYVSSIVREAIAKKGKFLLPRTNKVMSSDSEPASSMEETIEEPAVADCGNVKIEQDAADSGSQTPEHSQVEVKTEPDDIHEYMQSDLKMEPDTSDEIGNSADISRTVSNSPKMPTSDNSEPVWMFLDETERPTLGPKLQTSGTFKQMLTHEKAKDHYENISSQVLPGQQMANQHDTSVFVNITNKADVVRVPQYTPQAQPQIEKNMNIRMVHSGQYPFTCLIERCRKGFHSKAMLNMHQQAAHGIWPTEDEETCATCNIVIKSQHQKSLHSCFEFKCSKCYRTFSCRFNRDRHEKMHTELYQCDHCEKNYMSETNLIEHQRIHDEEYSKCPNCNFKTPYVEGLRRHMVKVHGRPQDVLTEMGDKS